MSRDDLDIYRSQGFGQSVGIGRKPALCIVDFVNGFVTNAGKVWGRPVGINVAKDGSLLFSEDGNGTVWRVSYPPAL